MLQFTSDQTKTLGETAETAFRQKSIDLLRKAEPELCDGRDDAVLDGHLDKVIEFCADHRILRESNVQRLMLLNARHRFIGKLDPYLSYILGRDGFSEDARIAEFRRAFHDPDRRIRINLGTDLSQYE